MNIVYMLENLNKKEGRRFYIGSKTECNLEVVDGINKIVSLKTGYPYYGSSQCPTMKDDMKSGHIFVAHLLEEVPNKKNMLEVENKWIVHHNAVQSEEFYNMSYAVLGGFMIDQHAMYNQYGETIMQYGKSSSSTNNRNSTAKRFGFDNLGEFSVYLHCMFELGHTSTSIATVIGWERHAPKRYIENYNMLKCIQEYHPADIETRKTVRDYVSKAVSVKKIAELTNLEIPTVCMHIGKFDEVYKKSFIVAQRRGQTKDELEIQVTKRILEGAGFNEVSRELSLNAYNVKRYFLRCARRHLKPQNLREE